MCLDQRLKAQYVRFVLDLKIQKPLEQKNFCFEECLNPEKCAILTSVMGRDLASPANDIIHPRFSETPKTL